MTTLPTSMLDTDVLIGNEAGWLLTFHREEREGTTVFPGAKVAPEIGRGDYYAEIRASMPEGLEGGVYTFVIEGMTDEHYRLIARHPGAPEYVKLHLFWMDTNASPLGYLKNVAGLTDIGGAGAGDDTLVAVLKIVSVTRRAGARRYETTITAREWVYERVSRWRFCPATASDPPPQTTASDMSAAVDQLLQGSGARLRSGDYSFDNPTPHPSHPPEPVEHQGAQTITLERGRTLVELLRRLGGLMEEGSNRYGRGMFLIRDGKLHVGTRPIPLAGEGTPPKRLTLRAGLIETEVLDDVVIDPNFRQCQNPPSDPPKRRQFKLTLKGRPDLKPGDTVEFLPPPEDVSTTIAGVGGSIRDFINGPLFPSLGGEDFQNAVTLYVASVEHRLGRRSGFVTTLTGVELGSNPTEKWDWRTPTHARSGEPEQASHASAEVEAARAVRTVSLAAAEARSFPEVGLVRAMTTSGTDEPPSQTLNIWRGLAPNDGRAGRARRLAVPSRSPHPATGVPYLTPFAFGKSGLVLPRYPGTRVLVDHRQGLSDDPVELGAFWESGHGPDSQAGDWWLSLPAAVPAAQRASIADEERPQDYTGKVSQDLIDADGNRVIEVGELMIRVGRDQLHDAGTRPERGDADTITIEHAAGGAVIVIDQNGKVKITAKQVEIDAGDGDIKLKGKNIELKAETNVKMEATAVDVKVSDAMDVHG